jgi:hypothetical protein
MIALMIAWQMVVAAQVWQAAQSAARSEARARSVDVPAGRAARAVLPADLATRAQVRRFRVGDREVVRVRIEVPRVLPFGPPLGAVSGEAEVVR